MTRNPRVLCVASEPTVGMVPFAAAVMSKLSERNECFAITVSGLGMDYSQYISGRIHQHSMKYPDNLVGKLSVKFFPIPLYRALSCVARENNITEIFFLTGEYGLVFFFGRCLRKKYNIHFVVHDFEAHPTASLSVKGKLMNRFFNRMTKKAVRLFDLLETCSISQYNLLRELFPDKHVVFYPFPSLVTEQMAKGVDVCPELKDLSGYVLFWGRVDLYKGVDLLYSAFLDSGLSESVTLVIAGKGEDYYPRRADEKNVIRINRFIEDGEVAQLFRRAAVVVFPYIQATMSGVLSVAHYFGTQVIASDVTFFKENAKRDDILFKSADIIDLQRCLIDFFGLKSLIYGEKI